MLAQRVGAESILYQGQFGIWVKICDNHLLDPVSYPRKIPS